MRIGVPKEIKADENRVVITPAGVQKLVRHGHQVFVEKSCGLGSGIGDPDYQAAGATVLAGPEEVFSAADMIMKVKEPLPPEYGL